MINLNDSVQNLMKIDGAMAAAIVDASSGMILGRAGSGVDIDIAGAGNTEVVRSKLRTMSALGIEEKIEDILITLGTQYHIIRPLANRPTVFIYLVLDKLRSNLAMARIKCADCEKSLVI